MGQKIMKDNFSNDCLRDYSLWYFGGCGSNYCVNCLSQYETVDVTDIAKGLIDVWNPAGSATV